ncbi:sugar phosphate isomerase/epimerase family protein [Nocardia sp. NPDC004123]
MPHPRLGCSTISFRHQDLPTALQTIAEQGFIEIDLGALPGVCDHVPLVLDDRAVSEVAKTVAESGLRVRSINADIGDLNRATDTAARAKHLDQLLTLAAMTAARALVLPCGALDRTPLATLDDDLDTVAAKLIAAHDTAQRFGIELWTESLHYFRLCCDIDRAQALTDRLDGSGVGIVMDFSHIVASGADPEDFVNRFRRSITHVHLRDAAPGNIHLSIGNGDVNFATGLKSLAAQGYTGQFSLELETRDITDIQRPAATRAAANYISELI